MTCRAQTFGDDISIGSLQERIESQRSKLSDLRQRRDELEREKSLLTAEIEQDIDRIVFLSERNKPEFDMNRESRETAGRESTADRTARVEDVLPIDQESREYIDDLTRMKEDLIREKEILERAVN